MIGPIFLEKIRRGWQQHLVNMYDFWYTVLFARAAYQGQPFIKHISLPIYKEHFDRWIILFHQAIDELYSDAVAEDTKQMAVKMSLLFQEKLKEMRTGIRNHYFKIIVQFLSLKYRVMKTISPNTERALNSITQVKKINLITVLLIWIKKNEPYREYYSLGIIATGIFQVTVARTMVGVLGLAHSFV